jgi:hypothetical protein
LVANPTVLSIATVPDAVQFVPIHIPVASDPHAIRSALPRDMTMSLTTLFDAATHDS